MWIKIKHEKEIKKSKSQKEYIATFNYRSLAQLCRQPCRQRRHSDFKCAPINKFRVN